MITETEKWDRKTPVFSNTERKYFYTELEIFNHLFSKNLHFTIENLEALHLHKVSLIHDGCMLGYVPLCKPIDCEDIWRNL